MSTLYSFNKLTLKEIVADKKVLQKQFSTFQKSPCIYNDINDWATTLIIYVIFGFILKWLKFRFDKFENFYIK